MPMVGGVKLSKKIHFQDYWTTNGCDSIKSICTTNYQSLAVYYGQSSFTSTSWGSQSSAAFSTPSLYLPELGQYNIQRANLMVAIREVENDTASVGSLNGENVSAVSILEESESGSGTIGLDFSNGEFKTPANHHSNNIIIYGNINVATALNGAGKYLILLHTVANQYLVSGTVILRDFRVGLRIYYK